MTSPVSAIEKPDRIWAYGNNRGSRVWTPMKPVIAGAHEEQEYVRADLSVDPFQVLLTPTSAAVPLTGNGVPQATTVPVQAPIHNPSNLSVVVNCGALAETAMTSL